jgi:ubiquinone/menaquinone biosynthesis C-methylase UbiE
VVDVGCGGGFDSLIAARTVGALGQVIGVDMTPAMRAMARASAAARACNLEFREGFGERLPIAAGWADMLVSSGVLNLMPDKGAALDEMARVLKPGGRMPIGDMGIGGEPEAKANREMAPSVRQAVGRFRTTCVRQHLLRTCSGSDHSREPGLSSA